jgi:hypothetical protein
MACASCSTEIAQPRYVRIAGHPFLIIAKHHSVRKMNPGEEASFRQGDAAREPSQTALASMSLRVGRFDEFQQFRVVWGEGILKCLRCLYEIGHMLPKFLGGKTGKAPPIVKGGIHVGHSEEMML